MTEEERKRPRSGAPPHCQKHATRVEQELSCFIVLFDVKDECVSRDSAATPTVEAVSTRTTALAILLNTRLSFVNRRMLCETVFLL